MPTNEPINIDCFNNNAKSLNDNTSDNIHITDYTLVDNLRMTGHFSNGTNNNIQGGGDIISINGYPINENEIFLESASDISKEEVKKIDKFLVKLLITS